MFASLITLYKGNRQTVLILTAIILIGIFLRTYHFSDWLLFEIDQSYDTRIVSEAVDNGIGNLPLLGPTAGGGRALRLGPAFYYMEYGSALIFGNTPTGHAMLVLILSILAIPLFFIFIQRYFSTPLSLALTALFSMSVYLVLYGRFSWSPNVLPFLILLSFYALLRSVSETETKRDRWFLIATTAITITSQIHFNAFFTIPTITLLFLLYKRPRFAWKTWVIALGIVTLIYSPMILSDINTGGENIGFFLKKLSKSGDPLRGLVRKSILDVQYTASGYFFVNSGIDRITGGRLKAYGFQNDANLPWRILAIILFCTQAVILVRNIIQEKMKDKKDFLVLVLLWVGIPFAYFYSLLSSNFQIYPRFYLLIAPVTIILLGFLLEKLQPERSASRNIFFISILFILLIPNLTRIGGHFLQLNDPTKNAVITETEDIFPNDKRLTLQEQLVIIDYLVSKQTGNHYPIYISTYHEYDPMFWYHLNRRGIAYFDSISYDTLYAEGNYFLIQYPTDGTRGIEKAFNIIEEKKFGTLTVYTLTPDDGKIRILPAEVQKREKSEQTIQIQQLKTWNSLLDGK